MAAMLASPILSHRTCGLIAAIASAIALGIAIASERWGGLVPCALCLLERWPYRIAIILGLAAALLPAQYARVALGLLALTMLGGAALGVIHVGVEFHLWPSPLPECAAPVSRGGSVAELLANMPATPSKPCDDPAYLVPGLKLSMAEMNLLFAAAFALVAGWIASRRPMS
ncbi:MAG TPA: disulfide bond formation protein B [Acetobacteraceae bacterium]|nr:disulfide bond formation protein B [Acetobacteraceae bacterium]